MPLNPGWMPMLWPGGPLEVALREKGKGFSTQAKAVLTRWQEPASLRILKDTPVNCLVVRWAAGLPQDAEQQQSLRALIVAGKAAGLAFIGLAGGGADQAQAAAAAEAAGLAALAVEGEPPRTGLPTIPWAEESKVPWKSASPVLAIDGVRWPGITMGSTRESEDVNAGATQAPWIDSNAYFLQMAAARGGEEKTFWLLFDPPAKGRVVSKESYLRAVADTGMAGGRWVLSLDDDLRGALAEGKPAAIETWRAIASAAGFFAKHPEWRRARPAGLLGVVSDFAGPNEMLGTEILNLLARRNLPYRVVAKDSAAAAAPFAGLKAACCLDEAAPAGVLRQQCEDFVVGGGLLFVSRSWGASGGTDSKFDHPRFAMRRLGKGRLVVCKEETPDPYLVARDVHMLLDRTNDLVRFYNITSLISHCTVQGGGSGLLQFVNYAQRAPDDVITAWLQPRYREAKLWTLGAASATPVEIAPENGGTAVHLPSIAVYAAIELSA